MQSNLIYPALEADIEKKWGKGESPYFYGLWDKNAEEVKYYEQMKINK